MVILMEIISHQGFGPKAHLAIFCIIHWFSCLSCSSIVFIRDSVFGWKHINFFCHILSTVSNHHLWDSVIWESMIQCSETLLNCSDCTLNFWNILLSCCLIHHYINFFECIFSFFELRIHMYPLDLKS